MASVGSGFSKRKMGMLALMLLASSCSGDQALSSRRAEPHLRAGPPRGLNASPDVAPTKPAPPAREAEGARAAAVSRAYAAELARRPELAFTELKSEIALRRAHDKPLSFDPTTARHYGIVSSQLAFTGEESAIFRQRGFVSVDHAQRYSMASLYYAIYARDLPVLVTTDSVLHALHRSFDDMLKGLEHGVFTHVIRGILLATQREVEREFSQKPGQDVATALTDVDLYLTVARNLLEGAGTSPEDKSFWASRETWHGELLMPSTTGKNAEALEILKRVSSLKMELPDRACSGCTSIYGGKRAVDWSQLRPRGHYEDSLELRRYFRTLMWLGRADLGFNLRAAAPISGSRPNVERERAAAATLSLLLKRSGALDQLQAMRKLVDFLVGHGDDVSPNELLTALDELRISTLAGLADRSAGSKLGTRLAQTSQQQIRSQVLGSHPGDTVEASPPIVMQLFGQRFVIDSFVLSKVVFDSIVYKGEKQRRMMPKGLDVMAALGNHEAVALLEPDLTRYNYSANLLASRRTLDALPASQWEESVYGMWLAALRELDDPLPEGSKVPEVMRSQAWQRKQLQTQHAAWAELRHDTLLYAKQSYTSYPMCGYPDAYVEPYPKLYRQLARLARRFESGLWGAKLSDSNAAIAKQIHFIVQHQSAFLVNFADTMDRLAQLADKQLAGKPFSAAEVDFLKKTIDYSGGGSGPPRYDGWYPGLYYTRETVFKWKPTIADVHTDPESGHVLEVGVGDANFLVLAVDSAACGSGHSVYVGPAYSYYEFTQPASNRMTDREWETRLSAPAPVTRPTWTSSFVAPASPRHLNRPPAKPRPTPEPPER
jgi:hypothetical protein